MVNLDESHSSCIRGGEEVAYHGPVLKTYDLRLKLD